MSNPSTTEMLRDRTAPQSPQRPGDTKSRTVGRASCRRCSRYRSGWPGCRRLCGSDDAGQDIWSTGPTRPSPDPAGATGPQGQQGVPGVKGATGPTGPAGALATTSVVASTALKSAPDPAVGTVLVAKTSCPAGKILLSGGAQVSAPGVQADRHVELRSSFPFSATQWQTVSIVTGSLGAGGVMTMKPFVVCGEAIAKASSTTPTK